LNERRQVRIFVEFQSLVGAMKAVQVSPLDRVARQAAGRAIRSRLSCAAPRVCVCSARDLNHRWSAVRVCGRVWCAWQDLDGRYFAKRRISAVCVEPPRLCCTPPSVGVGPGAVGGENSREVVRACCCHVSRALAQRTVCAKRRNAQPATPFMYRHCGWQVFPTKALCST
jgi:hypothetical protein